MKKKFIIYLALLITLILTIFLRVYKYQDWFAFDYDQEINAFIAKDVFVDHHIPLIGPETSTGGMYVGSFYNLAIGLFYFAFSMNPYSSVLLNVIISVITAYLFYLVGKDLFNTRVGLLSAFIYTFSDSLIRFDRTAWNLTPIMAANLLIILGLVRFIKTKNSFFLVVSSFGVGMMFHLHFIAIFSVIYFLLALCIILGSKLGDGTKRVPIKAIILSFLLIFAFVVPLILFDIRHNFINFTHLINFIFSGKGVSNSSFVDSLFKSINISIELCRAVVVNNNSLSANLITGLVIIFGLCFVGIRKMNLWKLGLISLPFIIVSLVMSFYHGPKPQYYYLTILPTFILLMSVFLMKIVRKNIIFRIPLLLFLIVMFYLNTISSSSATNDLGFKYKSQAVRYLHEQNVQSIESVEIISQLGLNTGLKYIFWWINNANTSNSNQNINHRAKIFIPVSMATDLEQKRIKPFGSIGVLLVD